MADDFNPLTPSSDYDRSAAYWRMVDAILSGVEAMRAIGGADAYTRAAGPTQPASSLAELNRRNVVAESPYLPKFENETAFDYDCRRRVAPLTNIYDDISKNLASKPFSKECSLDEKEGEDLQALSENIDGQGHNLHMFASKVFKNAVDKAIHWIMVDYTRVPAQATLADERNMGARPYWVSIPAEKMIAVYSDFIGGKELIYHARIHEPTRKIDPTTYAEVQVDRVRILEREPLGLDASGKATGYGPPRFELWELVEQKDASGKVTAQWILIDAGTITIPVIPLVAVVIGERADGCWYVKPELRNLAHMQVEEFQQGSNLKSIKEMAAFPMLAGNGVTPPTDANGAQLTVPVGPRAVLFAPMGGDGEHGEWSYISPDSGVLTFLQADLDKHRTEMRELGMQPMANANLTVITTANQAMKAHSQVQAWALAFKDALEQAWILTCAWLGQKKEPVVDVHTDFGVDFEAGTELDALQKARDSRVISNRLHFDELKRRGVLSDDADYEADQEEVAGEDLGQQLAPERMIDPVTGRPVVAEGTVGQPNPPPEPVTKPQSQGG